VALLIPLHHPASDLQAWVPGSMEPACGRVWCSTRRHIAACV